MTDGSGNVPPPGDKSSESTEPAKSKPSEPADYVFWNMHMTKSQYKQATSTFLQMVNSQLQKVFRDAIEAQKKAWGGEE